MPIRVRAKPPGEFIRDHLVDVGGLDYPQAIYKAYNEYLKSMGLENGCNRCSMSKYIWLANKIRLIVFDHAEPSEYWGGIVDGVTALPSYVRESRPRAPSPRHYYRIVNPHDHRWVNLEASYRATLVGPPVQVRQPAVRLPKPPKVKVEKPPVVKPKAEKPPAPPKPPRPPRVPKPPMTLLEPLKEGVRGVLPMLDELQRSPSLLTMHEIENELLDISAKVLTAYKKVTGAERTKIGDINSRLRRAVEETALVWSSVRRMLAETIPERRSRAEDALQSAIRVLREDIQFAAS